MFCFFMFRTVCHAHDHSFIYTFIIADMLRQSVKVSQHVKTRRAQYCTRYTDALQVPLLSISEPPYLGDLTAQPLKPLASMWVAA